MFTSARGVQRTTRRLRVVRSSARDAERVRPLVYRTLASFRRNQGLLLASAVAYNTLLSFVPLFIVLLAALSHLVDEQRLLDTLSTNLELLVPGQAAAITAQVKSFVIHRTAAGIVGFGVLVFFSSVAFTVLETAFSVIFSHRGARRRRHVLVSAIIPYLFIMSLGLGLLLVTMISAALDVVGNGSVHALGRVWSLAGLPAVLLHGLGVVGLVMILTALYMVLPGDPVAFRSALVGAVTATLLWELVRSLLVWYFAKLSMVNLVYGPFAGTIVLLLTLEVAAMILLLGAQVIAEVERAKRSVS